MASAASVRAGGAYVEISAKDAALKTTLADSKKSVDAFCSSIAATAADVGNFAKNLIEPMKTAVSLFADFDDQMRTVRAVSQSTGAEFQSLTKKARELGAATSWTAAQVAGGMAELGRAGFGAGQIEASIAGVMDLARATQSDVSEAATVASDAMNAFGMTAGDVGKICDLLAVATNSSAQNFQDLRYALQYASVGAKSAGASLEETLTMIGALANIGIKGSRAGTALRSLFVDPAVKANAKKVFNEYGIAVERIGADGAKSARPLLEILRELEYKIRNLSDVEKRGVWAKAFGKVSMDAASSLASLDFTGVAEKISKADGAANQMAADMDGGVGGAFRRLESATEALKISLGETFSGELNAASGALISAA
ncbi:MAG: phage tail tape measure protein, partial [Thermoguttaceae bacterium]|nr:phage tail tape measure protein [Thermoguttaceae bacterium]